jgi:hypothetical protein
MAPSGRITEPTFSSEAIIMGAILAAITFMAGHSAEAEEVFAVAVAVDSTLADSMAAVAADFTGVEAVADVERVPVATARVRRLGTPTPFNIGTLLCACNENPHREELRRAPGVISSEK